MAQSLDEMVKSLQAAVLAVGGLSGVEQRREVFEAVFADTAETHRLALQRRTERLVSAMVSAPATADIDDLLASGLSEDAVYELVVTAAVAAGAARLEAANKARRGG
jgi:alkylhydroperoxidase family enzyme